MALPCERESIRGDPRYCQPNRQLPVAEEGSEAYHPGLPGESASMLIVMESDATEEQIRAVTDRIRVLGLRPHPIPGAERTAIGITGNHGPLDPAEFEILPGVQQAIRVTKPYKLVSREVKGADSVVLVGGRPVGGPRLTIIAGPCAVESEAQTLAIARDVHEAGADLLRGGAFKPRTSPYSFQGLGLAGLRILARAREETGLPIVSRHHAQHAGPGYRARRQAPQPPADPRRSEPWHRPAGQGRSTGARRDRRGGRRRHD